MGFFYYNSVTPIPPYRTYLTYNSVTPEPGSKSYFTFYIDDTIDTESDGIDASVSSQLRTTAVFNLQGMKVADDMSNLPKGIYIVGGRKIIVP